MTNELASIQQELRIAKQEAEIMSLKFQLEKVQAEKASRLEDSLFAPALFPHYQKVAETLSKSAVIPTAYRGKPEDIFVAMAMGYQLGFPVEQSLQDVAVINGRPCLWGDGLLSLVLNHPECKSIKEEPIYNGQVVIGYICTVIRKGHEPHSKSFTMQDAERAGLLKKGGVWSAYPERMLQMRARSLALRDKFADALRGLRIAEIEQDDEKVIEGEIVNVTSPTSQVDKLKEQLLKGMPKNTVLLNEEEKPMNNESKENVIGDKDKPISQDDINKIEILMEEQSFDDSRKLKALNYFRVEKLSDLSDAQAKVFLFQLQGIKNGKK
jgi:hypothetical protein